MTQQPTRQLKLGAILGGVGMDHTSWRDPGSGRRRQHRH
jgi:hypothetical protein